VLLLSPYRPVEYWVGDFDLASLSFTPQTAGILDPGTNEIAPANYYATNILYAPDGRCILLGWVRGFAPGRGWNGCLAAPRVLTIGPDNRPRQTPVAELASLRGAHHGMREIDLASMDVEVDRLEHAAAELRVTLDPGDAARCGLRLAATNREGAALEIVYDRQTLLVAGVPAPLSLALGAPLELHLFLDGAVLEVFADDGRVAVTRAVDLPVGGVSVEALARGGKAYVAAYDRWEFIVPN
jgi:beta-fructofuranosidase